MRGKMEIIEIISGIFLLLGGSFIFIAALGVLRMPDIYTRIHSSTKAGTLGIGLILFSIALHFKTGEIITRSVATILYIVLTAPVTAQLFGMVAYKSGDNPWTGSLINNVID